MSEDLISREWTLNKIYDLVNDINGLPSESADRPQEKCEFCKDGGFIGARMKGADDEA